MIETMTIHSKPKNMKTIDCTMIGAFILIGIFASSTMSTFSTIPNDSGELDGIALQIDFSDNELYATDETFLCEDGTCFEPEQ